MINQFSCYLVNTLKENNLVQDKDYDWYVYGTELLVITIIKFVGLFILSYTLGLVKESLIFIFAFSILRNQAGGVHSDSFFRCFVITNIITIASISLVKYILIDFLYILLPILLLLSITIVFKYAPVDTPSRRLDQDDMIKYRKRSRVVVVAGVLIILTYTLIKGSLLYATIGAIGFFSEAVTLTPLVARKKI